MCRGPPTRVPPRREEANTPEWSETSTSTLCVAAPAPAADSGLEAVIADRLIARDGPERRIADDPTASTCLQETYDEVAETVLAEFAGAFAEEEDWRCALRLSTRRVLRHMAAHPDEAQLYFVDVLRGDHELLRQHVAARGQLVELCVRELGGRPSAGDLTAIRVELLIGACFHALAAAVEEGRLGDLLAIEAELASRLCPFDAVAA